ncbi:MAG TPA: hypothetical protein VMM13_02435 [Euzebya sp.]|nr:hypothetical protein [Euzebya sp.]
MRDAYAGERTPTRRRVAGAYVLLFTVAIAGLVTMVEVLGYDHPAAGPSTPEVTDDIDPLREEIPCEVAEGREGEERPTVTAEPSLPQAVTSNELYDCPGTWDGRRVRYVGEAIGAVLDRGDHAWVHLNDDVYAGSSGPLPTHRDFRGGNAGVGARLRASDAAVISTVGGPTQRGDLVEVIAIFRRVDVESNEVAVLDVESLTLVRAGEPFSLPTSGARSVVAAVAAVFALAVVVTERRRRGR